MIPGGSTAYVRGIGLLHSLGFRNFSLFGADSCYYEKPDMSVVDKMGRPRYLKVETGPQGFRKKFITDLQLLAQSQDFNKLLGKNESLNVEVFGDGMIAYLGINQPGEGFLRGLYEGTWNTLRPTTSQ